MASLILLPTAKTGVGTLALLGSLPPSALVRDCATRLT